MLLQLSQRKGRFAHVSQPYQDYELLKAQNWAGGVYFFMYLSNPQSRSEDAYLKKLTNQYMENKNWSRGWKEQYDGRAVTHTHFVPLYSPDIFFPNNISNTLENCTETMLTTAAAHLVCATDCTLFLTITNHNIQIEKRNPERSLDGGSQMHAALSRHFMDLISIVVDFCEANRQILPWSRLTNTFKRNQHWSRQARHGMCPSGRNWKIGQQISFTS